MDIFGVLSRGELGKCKKNGEKRQYYFRTPSKNNASITFGSGLWKETRFPNWPVFDYIWHEKAIWFRLKDPPTSCQIWGNHCSDKCTMFIHILCMDWPYVCICIYIYMYIYMYVCICVRGSSKMYFLTAPPHGPVKCIWTVFIHMLFYTCVAYVCEDQIQYTQMI